ncbi:cAMP-dependent protein kinase type I-alpha regulatory subunit-like [Convolutriloba macropyga]|uniref:cAMP-dependent protein kinase type I-alpha regulatory subunit-like n=1 Tax=Convolutriloba macropyga TaxID=536237 RepID=UPI003F51BA3B
MPKKDKLSPRPSRNARDESKSPMSGNSKSPRQGTTSDQDKSPNRLQQGSLRRGGVSSEAVDEDAIAKFEKRTFPKSAEEKGALCKALDSNILFRYLDENTRSDIFESMEPKTFKQGEEIITQGDEGDYFYLIHKGDVDVIVNKKKVSTLSEGGYFGELALIYGTPRSATCIVKSKEVKTFRLDRQHYRMLLMVGT